MKDDNFILLKNPEILEGIADRLDTIIKLIIDRSTQPETGFENLLTNADVQRILKVSSSTLQSLRSKGRIGFLKRGKKVYYTQEHIKEFLKEDESNNQLSNNKKNHYGNK